MKTLTPHLKPGEHLVYHLRPSRKWYHLALTLLADILIIAAVWVLFRFLQRSLAHSFLTPYAITTNSEYIAISLFLGLVPLVMAVAVAQDFLFTFFIELVLTDRRLFGRVGGLFWIKDLNIPLDEIQALTVLPGYLYLQRAGGPRLLLRGFHDTVDFIEAYRAQRLGELYLSDDIFDPLPDAFTFQNVR